ncbi:hypothetical protein [Methylobacterium sp. JK268]
MFLVWIKLVVTPLLMGLVSLAGRRWGGLVGGVVAGLPLTSGPISVYLALEQGPAFAAGAAAGALQGLAAVMASYAAYAVASRRWGLAGSVLAGLGAYAACAVALLRIGSDGLALALCLAALLVALRPEAGEGRAAGGAAPSRFDLPARMAAATLLVLGVTGAAPHLGPTLSGLASPIPVLGWPLIVFAHRQGGGAEARATLRGIAAGSLGVVLFNLVVAHGLVRDGLLPTYALAFLTSCAVSGATGLVLRRLAPAAR